jgi:hypothetical protein
MDLKAFLSKFIPKADPPSDRAVAVAAGALVLSPEPIAVGSAVSINSKELQLMGNATVRHCTARKSQFLVGLEFRGSLVRSY